MSSVYNEDPDTGLPRDRRPFENPPDPCEPGMAASYHAYLDSRNYGETWEHWAARQSPGQGEP
jgi:hypothetical protein